MMTVSTITDTLVLQRIFKSAPNDFLIIVSVCKLWNRVASEMYDTYYRKVSADIFGRELWMKHFSKEPVQYSKPSFALLKEFDPANYFLTFFPQNFKDMETGEVETFSVEIMMRYCQNVKEGFPIKQFHISLTRVAQQILPIDKPRWVKLSKKAVDKNQVHDFFDVFVTLHADYIKTGKSYFHWDPNSRTYKYKVIKLIETNSQYLMCTNRDNIICLFTTSSMPTSSKP